MDVIHKLKPGKKHTICSLNWLSVQFYISHHWKTIIFLWKLKYLCGISFISFFFIQSLNSALLCPCKSRSALIMLPDLAECHVLYVSDPRYICTSCKHFVTYFQILKQEVGFVPASHLVRSSPDAVISNGARCLAMAGKETWSADCVPCSGVKRNLIEWMWSDSNTSWSWGQRERHEKDLVPFGLWGCK